MFDCRSKNEQLMSYMKEKCWNHDEDAVLKLDNLCKTGTACFDPFIPNPEFADTADRLSPVALQSSMCARATSFWHGPSGGNVRLPLFLPSASLGTPRWARPDPEHCVAGTESADRLDDQKEELVVNLTKAIAPEKKKVLRKAIKESLGEEEDELAGLLRNNGINVLILSSSLRFAPCYVFKLRLLS